MKNEFVSYEIALALKELGFNEPCMAIYYSKDKSFSWHHHKDHTNDEPALDSGEFNISATTYSAAFRWFREKYFLHSYISCSCTVNEILSYDWVIHKVMNNGTREENFITDYEQTYEAAELECLKKLIEIVKAKNETT